MTGGWRPPTPPEPNWLDDLPAAPQPEGLVEGAFYVVRGTVVGSSSSIVNPIVQFFEGALHLTTRAGTGSAWHYVEDEDILVASGNTSSGMSSNLRGMIGEEYTTGGSRSVGDIDKPMIVARFL